MSIRENVTINIRNIFHDVVKKRFPNEGLKVKLERVDIYHAPDRFGPIFRIITVNPENMKFIYAEDNFIPPVDRDINHKDLEGIYDRLVTVIKEKTNEIEDF